MSITLVADPGGTKGIVQINGVDKLEINADGSIVALDPVDRYDDTVGRILQVGDFGVGAVVQTLLTDANALTENGWYPMIASALNMPRANGGIIRHVNYNADYASQLYTGVSSNKYTYFRVKNVGVWEDWTQIHSQSNILGTVSQSAGVPTGAIIETGSNANGEYTKFADGTLICWNKISISGTQLTTNVTNLHASEDYTWTFPAPFISIENGVSCGGGRQSNDSIEVWGSVRIIDETTARFRMYSDLASSSVGMVAYATAIGRWF